MRSRSSRSILGRPACRRDFQFQSARKPRRCQPSTVSGLTTVIALRSGGNAWYRQTRISRSMSRSRTVPGTCGLAPSVDGEGRESQPPATRECSAQSAPRTRYESETRTSGVALAYLPALRHADEVLNCDRIREAIGDKIFSTAATPRRPVKTLQPFRATWY
jgi:hypothetical protein